MLTTEFVLDLPRHDYMRLKLKNLLKPFFLVTLKVNNIFVQQVKKTKNTTDKGTSIPDKPYLH